MKNLLVAIDGSEHCKRAAERALELAKILSAKITIITAIAPVPQHWAGTSPVYVETLVQKQEAHAHVVAEQYKKFFEEEGLEATTVVQKGDPAEEINKVVDAGDYYMVIMGSRGLTGIKRALLGSVTNNVVQSCKIPVLVVK